MYIDKLTAVLSGYEEMMARLENPAVYGDPSVLAELQKQVSLLQPLADLKTEYDSVSSELQSAIELTEDPEYAEMAHEEIASLKARLDDIDMKIKAALIPANPEDDKNAILEIRCGVGGEESALFANVLFRMYCLYSDSKGWKTEIINSSFTELGGIKEVSFVISGKEAYSRLKYEGGTHRVQRVPVTESGGRIHTSAATVAVFPEVEETEYQLDPNDLRIDTYRSSGAGGQHVNKTESAIRLTHIPTGIVVECQDERSQYRNKDKAMRIMRSKLHDLDESNKNSEKAADRKNQVGSGDRSGKIRTYNFPQSRVTDHRIEGSGKNFNIESVVSGNLDPIIDELKYTFEKLNGNGQ